MLKTCCGFAERLRHQLSCSRNEQGITPLSKLCKAGKVRICKVTGDRKLCARMAAMGLNPGTDAELICPENGSQCILKIHGGKVCLDRTLSENILVTGR